MLAIKMPDINVLTIVRPCGTSLYYKKKHTTVLFIYTIVCVWFTI